jgi:hypothetical protein
MPGDVGAFSGFGQGRCDLSIRGERLVTGERPRFVSWLRDGEVMSAGARNGVLTETPTLGTKWRATTDDDEHYISAIAL